MGSELASCFWGMSQYFPFQLLEYSQKCILLLKYCLWLGLCLTELLHLVYIFTALFLTKQVCAQEFQVKQRARLSLYGVYILYVLYSGCVKQLQISFKIQSSRLFTECGCHVQSKVIKADVMTVGVGKRLCVQVRQEVLETTESQLCLQLNFQVHILQKKSIFRDPRVLTNICYEDTQPTPYSVWRKFGLACANRDRERKGSEEGYAREGLLAPHPAMGKQIPILPLEVIC